MLKIAEQLTAARKAAGMTQEQVAEAVHVARNTISNWERGRRQPDLATLRLLGEVLHADFVLSDEDAEAENTEAEAADEIVGEDSVPGAQPSEKKRTLSGRTRLYMILVAVILALMVIAAFVVVPALRDRSVPSTANTGDPRYSILDFDQTTPNEADKAYLTIVKTLSVRPGDGRDYYAINFRLREDNGIAFSIERLDMVIFFSDHADPFVFSKNDLAGAGYDPDIPAYGFLSIDNGFPTDQKGLQGMGIWVLGKDANGAERTFTAYQPIP